MDFFARQPVVSYWQRREKLSYLIFHKKTVFNLCYYAYWGCGKWQSFRTTHSVAVGELNLLFAPWQVCMSAMLLMCLFSARFVTKQFKFQGKGKFNNTKHNLLIKVIVFGQILRR
jgi:hypothetical protein